jgi:hypothetical protein
LEELSEVELERFLVQALRLARDKDSVTSTALVSSHDEHAIAIVIDY